MPEKPKSPPTESPLKGLTTKEAAAELLTTPYQIRALARVGMLKKDPESGKILDSSVQHIKSVLSREMSEAIDAVREAYQKGLDIPYVESVAKNKMLLFTLPLKLHGARVTPRAFVYSILYNDWKKSKEEKSQ